MGAGLLEGMPELLRALSSGAHPNEVAAALVEGPGRQFGAVSGAVLWARPAKLIVVGLHGWQEEELTGLDSLPIDVDYPVAQAFRDGTVIIEPIRTSGERYPSLLDTSLRWRRTMERNPEGALINSPVVVEGRCIGAFSLVTPVDRQWSALDIALLSVMSSALGLWMAHPDSGLAPDDRVTDVDLSERQRRILVLVEAGRTNAAIAASLGYSESTVKQEIRRTMTLLGTPDRAASAGRARMLGLLPDAR